MTSTLNFTNNILKNLYYNSGSFSGVLLGSTGSGDTGSQGPQGPQGVTGPPGTCTGFTGPQGLIGPTDL